MWKQLIYQSIFWCVLPLLHLSSYSFLTGASYTNCLAGEWHFFLFWQHWTINVYLPQGRKPFPGLLFQYACFLLLVIPHFGPWPFTFSLLSAYALSKSSVLVLPNLQFLCDLILRPLKDWSFTHIRLFHLFCFLHWDNFLFFEEH